MTAPNKRYQSPSRTQSVQGTYASNTIPTKDIVAKVKADILKKKEREKQVEKVIKEQIDIKRYKVQQLNARCEDALDKVKSNQRALDSKSRKQYSMDLSEAEQRLQKKANDR